MLTNSEFHVKNIQKNVHFFKQKCAFFLFGKTKYLYTYLLRSINYIY